MLLLLVSGLLSLTPHFPLRQYTQDEGIQLMPLTVSTQRGHNHQYRTGTAIQWIALPPSSYRLVSSRVRPCSNAPRAVHAYLPGYVPDKSLGLQAHQNCVRTKPTCLPVNARLHQCRVPKTEHHRLLLKVVKTAVLPPEPFPPPTTTP